MNKQNFCPSCGLDYIHHDGLIPICADLQKAKLRIDKLRKAADKLQKRIGCGCAGLCGACSKALTYYKRVCEGEGD